MMHLRLPAALAATAALSLAGAGIAVGAHDTNPSDRVASYSYALNGVQTSDISQASGSTRIKALPNGKVQVKVEAWGLSPHVPHAMHLHGVSGPGLDNACPGPEADTDGDGFVSVPEGGPFYGGILTSLTTTGDTSPDSALALGRFPTADASGYLSYSRTFSDTAALANADTVQVVVHGIDVNMSGGYDLDGAGEAPLVPGSGIPFEATMPVLCGGIPN